MTLLQQNFVTAKPINFYYLVCKLDRVQYPHGRRGLVDYLPQWIAAGLIIVGGCCTTTPQDIAALHEYLKGGAYHD